MQEWVVIGMTSVPVILDEGGENYYPIRYITEKVLLRNGKSIIHKSNKEQYNAFIKKFTVEYGDNNIQESNCISEKGLKMLLSKTQVGRLSAKQRKSQNHLHVILGIPLLTEAKVDIEHLSRDNLKQHDQYTREIIKFDIEKHEKLTYRLCSKCNKYHPLTSRYYPVDNRASNGHGKICKVCLGVVEVFTNDLDKDAEKLKKQSEDLYNAYRANDLIKIFEAYRSGSIKYLPESYENRDDYLKLIKYLFSKGELNSDNVSIDKVRELSNLRKLNKMVNLHDIYSHIFGKDYFLYPWRYKNFKFTTVKLNEDIAIKVFKKYLTEFNVEFDDPLNFNYEYHVRKAKIAKYTNGRLLEFTVKFNDNKYAGYMFKLTSGNYYKTEENLLFDLKYLVERDMRIEIDKVPLYITKNTLQKKAPSIYRHIVTLKNENLFHWFNKLYVNKFIETDFDINAYRLEFDSDVEAFLHDLLKEKFNNRVIYNQRNGEREIRLSGMSPDWFIFTDKRCWIVEYFGMFEWKNRNNSRIRVYIKKTISKLRRYSDIDEYGKLFLYPEDIVDDYKGVVEKLKRIELELDQT